MKINSVNEYIQKREILDNLKEYLDGYVRPVLLVDKFIYEKYKNKFDEFDYPILFENIAYESDVVIGIGGGGTMDQAKKLTLNHLILLKAILQELKCFHLQLLYPTPLEQN